MKTVTVQVRNDHLEVLARTKPMSAMAELIWNAFDAEATEVRVEFIENELQGLECIRIIDNGHGLRATEATLAFQNLGGSWKREGQLSPSKKRTLHGKFGKGRFRAFTMGTRVNWNATYLEDNELKQITIKGQAETLGQFQLSDAEPAFAEHTGMVVNIENPPLNANLLRGGKANQEITDIFALYLKHYPDTKLVYDGVPVDAENAQLHLTDYSLDPMVMENGEQVQSELTIVEWNIPGKRGVYFCDAAGFMLHNALPRLHFRGFSYTAYLKSAHLATLDREGMLQAGELSADVRQILDAARAKLREHFALREAELAQDALTQWQNQGLYPYEGKPVTDEDSNERRIFDIYATHLNQIFPDFKASPVRSKRLMLLLLQELVKTEPTRVARVLDNLVDFPEDKEEAILELVQS